MLKEWFLPGTVFFLSLISILILRSVAPSLLERQVLFFVLGGGIFWMSSRLTFRHWQGLSNYLYVGLIFGLVLTQLVATVTRGTKSWIALGPFHAQPSQVAIACTALLLGQLFSAQQSQSMSIKRYFVLCALILLPVGLILTEPDLGTSVVYLLSCGAAFLFTRVPYKYLLGTLGLGIVAVALSWMFFLKPYQKLRITSFINGNGAEQSASYNAVQSVIAVGSGGTTGKGLGQGTQSQLRFLPERQTDFVFASFAEETGFIGGGLVITLYGFLIGICFVTIRQNIPLAAQLFVLVTGVMFLVQVGVNIGMNIGLVPITGITLPFISYGGSSILALSFQLGCVQSIIRDLKPRAKLLIR
jgi:rod shape determining protein RodA